MSGGNLEQIWIMNEKEVFAQATAILKAQQNETKSWGYEEHAELVARIAAEHGLPQTLKAKFKHALLIQGVCGNSSQFRQWLRKKGISMKKSQRGHNIFEALRAD